MLDEGCGERPWRLAGDRLHLVTPLAVGELGGAADALLSVRSLEPAAPLAAAALREPAGADLRPAAPLRARPPPGRRPARRCAPDPPDGAPPRPLLAARAHAARARPPRRPAVPRRTSAR